MEKITLLLVLAMLASLCSSFGLVEDESAGVVPAEGISPEDAATFEQIENEDVQAQSEMFFQVIPGPLTLKQTLNFSAYAGFVLPNFVREWSLGGTGRDYSTLPELMTFADGTPVTSDPADLQKRRVEMLEHLQTYVYGPIPTEGYATEFAVQEQGEALDGAAKREQVQITITTDKGSLPMNLLIYTPAGVEKSPVILCLTSGNYTALDDPTILPDASQSADDTEWEANRGSSAEGFQVAEGIVQGYGYAFISVNDVAPDNMEAYATKLVSLFDEPDFMAISAWVFGMSRAIDYLVTDPAVDTEKIAVYGHSRYGKAALWAGAYDERIGLVFAHQSGGGGAALNRANNADNIHSLTQMEPWWFCANYASYADAPDELPVDAHFAIACVAPRKIYVSNGINDLWADPQGSLNGLLYARPMFEAYGLDVIPAEYQPNETVLAAGDRIFSASMATHVTDEFHTASPEDWAYFFDYMNQYFK